MADDDTPKACALKVLASFGGGLVTTVATADGVQKFIGLPGQLWIIVGTIVAVIWGYQSYCLEDIDP